MNKINKIKSEMKSILKCKNSHWCERVLANKVLDIINKDIKHKHKHKVVLYTDNIITFTETFETKKSAMKFISDNSKDLDEYSWYEYKKLSYN